MNTPIVLTVISNDQPGIIRLVSEALKKHGGNWTQSSMSSLAGQFAGILLASVPQQSAEACLEELEKLESEGLHITATVSKAPSRQESTSEYSLELVGNDHPGIVHAITTVLAGHGVSVRELETKVESGSMAGGMIFRARASLEVPRSTDIRALEFEIENLANDLMVEIHFEN